MTTGYPGFKGRGISEEVKVFSEETKPISPPTSLRMQYIGESHGSTNALPPTDKYTGLGYVGRHEDT